MNFLAKTKNAMGNSETIEEHTNNLIDELKLLCSMYRLPINVQQLAYVARLHDLGKINQKFQNKIRDNNNGKQVYMEDGEYPHPVFSAALVDKSQIIDTDEYHAVEAAVLYHHGLRNFDLIDYDELAKQVKTLPLSDFPFSEVGLLKPTPVVPDLPINKYPSADTIWFNQYVLLLGFLHRLDYSASGHYPVEVASQQVVKHINSFFMKKNLQYNDMQMLAKRNTDNNIILVAQTGMGKTEAALNWIGNNKGFMVLPLRTAINQQYHRILNNYVDDAKGIGIVHSTARSVLSDNNVDQSVYKEYKSFSAPLTISTADQILRFSLRYYGWETLLATLSYSHVVIDEIQAYEPNMLGYILNSIKSIQDAGGKTMIMSATIYPFVRDLMTSMNIKGISTKNYIDSKLDHRHSIKVHRKRLRASDFIEDAKSKKTLVIVNTVHKAQELYTRIKEEKNINVHVLTSRFILKDKKMKEQDIINATGPCVWICTQVVEASIDIDFDVLYTELSDLASLFQRMGRVYRRRNYTGRGYNVHLFVGSDTVKNGIPLRNVTISGYGTVYDSSLLELAVQATKYLRGNITEEKKYQLLDKYYTSDKLKESSEGRKYLNKFNEAIDFVKNSKDQYFTKQEVAKLFRNLDTYTCIPLSVYNDNKDTIDDLVANYQKNPVETDTKIRNYTVELYKDKLEGSTKQLEYGYHKVFLPDVYYDSQIGVK